MASSRDLTYGQNSPKHDDLLRQVDELVPNWLDSTYPTGDLAKIIWLDQQAGKDSPDNLVLMAPGYAMWLPACVTIIDEDYNELLTLAEAASEAADTGTDAAPNDELNAKMLALQTRGFKVKFTFPPEEDEDDDLGVGIDPTEAKYPEWLEGTVRTVRVLTDEQAESHPPIYTATPDGQRIMLETVRY